MKKHVNIPIFIPHLGCPNQCVFCNQRTISGRNCFDLSTVNSEIEAALQTIDPSVDAEIAFFGGSFTGIDRALMTALLEIAYKYVRDGRVSSIRCSTRPDYIDDEILSILSEYGVRTIELGLQSSSDRVLSVTKRGHTRAQEEYACRMIVERGFNLVGQMMIGLPDSTLDDEIKTAENIVAWGAKAARIYPTVVFKDTELSSMTLAGDYSPITEDDAVYRSAKVLDVFVKAGVDVIRIGLCAQDALFDSEKYCAGPNHPALGELIVGEYYYDRFAEAVSRFSENDATPGGSITIFVARGKLSQALGQKRKNAERLIERFDRFAFKFKERDDLSQYKFDIYYERKY